MTQTGSFTLVVNNDVLSLLQDTTAAEFGAGRGLVLAGISGEINSRDRCSTITKVHRSGSA